MAGKTIHVRLMSGELCAHLEDLHAVQTAARRQCDECVKVGSGWVHLRTCQACGATLCCNSSPMRHASKHARQSGHPVVASAEPDEQWVYCYDDDVGSDFDVVA